jgi:hypothetical protein
VNTPNFCKTPEWGEYSGTREQKAVRTLGADKSTLFLANGRVIA